MKTSRGEFSSFLYANFTDTELRSITYSILGPGAYEQLHGANKLAKVTSLLEFLESANRIGELIQEVQERKPDIDLPRAIIEDELEPPQQGRRESQPSKVEPIEEQRGQARSTPPEFAERMRQRRPGYDRVFKLTQEYNSLPSDERERLREGDVLDRFVRPMFEALGWQTSSGKSVHLGERETTQVIHTLVVGYDDFTMPVEVTKPVDPLSSEADNRLLRYVRAANSAWGILTNFEAVRIWDFKDPNQSNIVLETDPWSYIADDREEDDLLAAEIFYQRLVRPASEAPAPKMSSSEALSSQSSSPVEMPSEPHEVEKSESIKLTEEPRVAVQPELGRYGQPDGPRQRFEEVVAGISFGGGDAPARTITALVTGRTSKRPLLLLAGGTLPSGAEIIQPAPAHGGSRQDTIGIVEREVFNERCLAAVAHLEGDRPFLSTLPDGQPVAGVARPSLGLQVCKFGAGSGYTRSQVVQVAINFELTDDYQRKIVLQDSILIAGPDFSAPGDVGALVLTTDTYQAVGVIVGHIQDQATACLPIQDVLDQLGLDLVTRPVRYRSAQRATDRITATTDLIGGEDRLGFGHYVDAFVRLIEDTQPPLTIGIYGAWGTGKSFLMDKIAKRLKPEGDVKQVEKLSLWQKMFRLSRTQMPVIWFDAWDYNASDKLWAGLVERIFLGIENSGLGWYGQLRINLKRNLERRWRELRARLLPYTLIAIVIAALTVGFILNNQDAWAKAVGGSTFLVLLIGLVRQLVGVFGTSASQRIVDLFATPDYTADIGFMGRIRQDLEDFANSLPKGMKVVVFIDDLDRCDPKKAVEVLEAMKLLLDFERFIVFLALDARIITQAVEEHYGKMLAEAEITGYEYLDKIVQIPFSIPEPPPNELRKYIGSLVGLSEADIPPIETVAVRQPQGQVGEKEQPPEFVEEPITPGREAAEPMAGTPPPSETTAIPTQRAEEPVSTPQPAEPAGEGQAIEDMFDTSVVTFTRAEQQALLSFYAHLDPNPRRIKRVVNIYRLVRALMASQQEAQQGGQAPAALLDNPHHILGWLILCEQWPYAAHVMMEEFDRSLKQTEPNLGPSSALMQLHQVAQGRIAQEGEEALKKLDLKYDRLHSFIETHLHDFTLADLQRLWPYTVNFNPALSAEVRLTLSRGG